MSEKDGLYKFRRTVISRLFQTTGISEYKKDQRGFLVVMNVPNIKHQKYNIHLAKLLNLIIDLDEEQQRLLLKEIEEKYLKEKRGYVRQVGTVPVRYINNDRIFSSFIINFSQDGCFIRAVEPLFIGEEILMDVGLDTYDKAIRVKGIVAHVNRLGIGVKFKELITISSEV